MRARAAIRNAVRAAGGERNPRHPVARLGYDAFLGVDLALDLMTDRATRGVGVVHLAGRRGRDERVAVYLAVGMIDGGADLAAAVLEHEHVLDLRAGEERLRPIRPQIDDLAAPVRRGRLASDWSCSGEEQHDPARALDRGTELHRRQVCDPRRSGGTPGRERGPPAGEPADVVRTGRLQAADAERATVAREILGLSLAVADDGLTHSLASAPNRSSPSGGSSDR